MRIPERLALAQEREQACEQEPALHHQHGEAWFSSFSYLKERLKQLRGERCDLSRITVAMMLIKVLQHHAAMVIFYSFSCLYMSRGEENMQSRRTRPREIARLAISLARGCKNEPRRQAKLGIKLAP